MDEPRDPITGEPIARQEPEGGTTPPEAQQPAAGEREPAQEAPEFPLDEAHDQPHHDRSPEGAPSENSVRDAMERLDRDD